MDLIRATAFVHIIFSILLVGQALYWMIMVTALNKRHGAAEADRLLQAANRARWPHVVVPHSMRLPLPWIAWLTLAAIAGTGAISLALRGFSGDLLWWIKLGLFVAIAIVQVPLTRRPAAGLTRINFALVISAIVISGWAVR